MLVQGEVQEGWVRCSVFGARQASGPVAQLVRAPPCHGGGRRFKSVLGRFSCFYILFVKKKSLWGVYVAFQAVDECPKYLPYKAG